MAKKTEELLELSQCCTVLNMTEDEILYLVRTRAIPHRVEADGRLRFTKWEILTRVIPKPTTAAMGTPQFDISAMSKDDIMELFSKVLQAKAADDEKELKKKAPVKDEAEGRVETVYPDKKEEPKEPAGGQIDARDKEESEEKEEPPETADAGPDTQVEEKQKAPDKKPGEKKKPTASQPKK